MSTNLIYPPRRGSGRGGEHRWAGVPPTAYVWPRVPRPLWPFALLTIFPPKAVSFHVSRLTFPCFLFLLHFLQLPVLSRISPPKILLSMPTRGPSFTYFSTSLYPFLPCISFSFCISLSRTSLFAQRTILVPKEFVNIFIIKI